MGKAVGAVTGANSAKKAAQAQARALEEHAKALGCTALVISCLAMVRQESYGHYLKRKGFREVSREYVKGI